MHNKEIDVASEKNVEDQLCRSHHKRRSAEKNKQQKGTKKSNNGTQLMDGRVEEGKRRRKT